MGKGNNKCRRHVFNFSRMHPIRSCSPIFVGKISIVEARSVKSPCQTGLKSVGAITCRGMWKFLEVWCCLIFRHLPPHHMHTLYTQTPCAMCYIRPNLLNSCITHDFQSKKILITLKVRVTHTNTGIGTYCM